MSHFSLGVSLGKLTFKKVGPKSTVVLMVHLNVEVTRTFIMSNPYQIHAPSISGSIKIHARFSYVAKLSMVMPVSTACKTLISTIGMYNTTTIS